MDKNMKTLSSEDLEKVSGGQNIDIRRRTELDGASLRGERNGVSLSSEPAALSDELLSGVSGGVVPLIIPSKPVT